MSFQIINLGNCKYSELLVEISHSSYGNILKFDFAEGREISWAGELGGLYRPPFPRAPHGDQNLERTKIRLFQMDSHIQSGSAKSSE